MPPHTASRGVLDPHVTAERHAPSPLSFHPASLAAGRAALRAVQESFHTVAERRGRHRMIYLDTFDGRLARRGDSLAAIREDEGWLLTWRTADDAVRGRQHADALPAFARDLPEGDLRRALAPELDVRRVLQSVIVEAEQQAVRILDADEKTVLRVVLERVRARDPDGPARWVPLRPRLLLLPVRGCASALRRMARFLEDERGLGRGAPAGDRVLALRAVGKDPRGHSSKFRLELDPTMRSGRAVRRILRELLDAMKANEPGTFAALDPEFLHDFRVAVRRTRSCLGQLEGVLPPDQVEPFRRQFSWLGTLTGPARDLDVHAILLSDDHGTVPTSLSRNLESLRLHVDERLERERSRVAKGLKSTRYRALVKDWERFLDDGKHAEESGSPEAGRPILEIATESLERAFRKVLKNGRRVKADTPDEKLHRLRIACKKLRYLLEFFRSLYDPSSVATLVKSLKSLQDCLGSFNDCVVHRAALRSYRSEMAESGRADVDTLTAMGRLAAWMEERQDRERRRFARRFARFAAMEPRFRELVEKARLAAGKPSAALDAGTARRGDDA